MGDEARKQVTAAAESVHELGQRLSRSVDASVEESTRRANRLREALGGRAERYELEARKADGTSSRETIENLAVAIRKAQVESTRQPNVTFHLWAAGGERILCTAERGRLFDEAGIESTVLDLVERKRG